MSIGISAGQIVGQIVFWCRRWIAA